MAPFAAALALTMALAAGPAWGYGYTTVNPPPGGEASHLEIIAGIYSEFGGTWSYGGDLGLDLINDGGITAKRTYDYNGGDEIIHVLLGNQENVDQVWTDGIVTVTAEVKYAEFSQSFGWNGGGSTGDVYYELLTDADLGGSPEVLQITGDFLWGIQPTDGHPYYGNQYTWWSRQSENEDPYYGKDHMVTYFVEGLPDTPYASVWLLFWEDYPCAGDEDFNDFVIEVRAVPEPSTGLLLAMGLLAFGLRRRLKN